MFYLMVTGQFPDYSSVPRANHQHLFYRRMDSQRHVCDHLVIDKFILFRQHHITVQRQKPSKFRGIKDVNPLEFTLAAVELAVYPDGQLYPRRVFFRKPEIHVILLSVEI